MSEALELLEDCEPKKALKIGKELEKMRYSGGFEIQALAYADLDKKKKAIKILEKGVEIAPNVWPLWQLLGSFHSDEKEFDRAITAYEKGLQVDQSDKISLNYNYAIALERDAKYEKAQSRMSAIFSNERYPDDIEKEQYIGIQSLRMSLLNNLKQFQEALKLFAELKSMISQHEISNPSEISYIFTEAAQAYWKLGNQKHAETYLKKAITCDKHNKSMQWLCREINDGKNYSNSKYYRLIIQGKWTQPFEGESKIPEFYTDYDVVADNEEEALEFIKYFEPPEIHSSLKIDEVEILGSSKQPKGIYSTSGYGFYTDY